MKEITFGVEEERSGDDDPNYWTTELSLKRTCVEVVGSPRYYINSRDCSTRTS